MNRKLFKYFFLLLLLLSQLAVFVPTVKAQSEVTVTYDGPSNIMALTGGTEESPIDNVFWEFWNASYIHGWNVSSQTNENATTGIDKANQQFLFDCMLQIGDGENETWVTDSYVSVAFADGMDGWTYSSCAINVEENASFVMGKVVDEDTKVVYGGVHFTHLEGTVTGAYLIGCNQLATQFHLYACSFNGPNTVGMRLSVKNGSRLWHCSFTNVALSQSTAITNSATDIYACWTTGGETTTGTAWVYPRGNIEDFLIADWGYGLYLPYKGPENWYRNLKFRNIQTKEINEVGDPFNDQHFINPDYDQFRIKYSLYSSCKYWLEWDYDIHVQASNQAPIENANVTVWYGVGEMSYSHEEYLYVDGYEEYDREWTETGADPWLDALDYPTNYISTTTHGAKHGDFTFENSTTMYDRVTIQVYVQGDAPVICQLYLYYWDGTAWRSAIAEVPDSWGWLNFTATYIDTLEKLNGLQVYLRARLIPSGSIEVDCVRVDLESGTMVYDEAFSELTDANGDIDTKTLIEGYFSKATSGTLQTYNPCNLTVTYGNYTTYTTKFNLTEKTDWTIALSELPPPVARFTYSPSNPQPQQTITFSATESISYDGITSYFWNFGDGANGTGETTTHSYSSAGSYPVSLTVTDSHNLNDTMTQTITVRAPPTVYYPPTPSKQYDLTVLVFDQYCYPIEGVDVEIYLYSQLILSGKTDEYGAFIAKRQTANRDYLVKVTYENRAQETTVLLDRDKTVTFEYALITFDIVLSMFERNWLFILLAVVVACMLTIKWKTGWVILLVLATIVVTFYADYRMFPLQFKLFFNIIVMGVSALIVKARHNM